MDSKIVMFSILAFAAIFAMAAPMDAVYAQTTDIMPDGEGDDKDGKMCPFKGNNVSVISSLI